MVLTLADQYYIKALDYYEYDMESVMDNLNYALGYDPEHAAANCLMGRLHASWTKDGARAEACFQAALAYDPDYAETYCYYAELLLQMRKFKRLTALLNYAESVKGVDTVQLSLMKAQMLEQQKQFEEAEQILIDLILEAICPSDISSIENALERVRKKMNLQVRYLYSA